jgi:hypothetical protein
MQAGFTPQSTLGTTLEVPLDNPSNNSYAQAAFDQSMNTIDGVNEKNIVYPKFSTALQGMTFTKVPTGGYSGPPPSILIGADVGGSLFNASNPTYFNQPGYTAGSRSVEMTNGVPLTGERPGAELVYKTADGKLRNPRGASTVARAQQEAAQGRRRAQRVHNEMLGIGSVLPTDSRPIGYDVQQQAANAAAQLKPAVLATTRATSAPPPTPMLATTANSDPPAAVQSPVANLNSNWLVIDATVMPTWKPSVGNFTKSAWKWANGQLEPKYQASYWQYNWPYLVCMILFILFIVFFITAIAVGASRKGPSMPQLTNVRPL